MSDEYAELKKKLRQPHGPSNPDAVTAAKVIERLQAEVLIYENEGFKFDATLECRAQLAEAKVRELKRLLKFYTDVYGPTADVKKFMEEEDE